MSHLTLEQRVSSKLDTTQKFIFTTDTGKVLEVAYIDKNDGKDILCVPTQSGCTQGCLFCHMTGSGLAWATNLTADEIATAVELTRALMGLSDEKPLLVSYMGCGEPLRNPSPMLNSMLLLKVVVPQIRFGLATILPRGSEERLIQVGRFIKRHKINLKVHLSLHFTDDVVRQKWMPSAAALIPSLDLLRWYRDYTGNKIEIHYSPIQGVNDSFEDAQKLSSLIAPATPIKLLHFNPKEGLPSVPSEQTNEFDYWLHNLGLTTELYTPPGRDIGASCGQFDLQFYKETV